MATETCANHNLILNAFHRSMVSQRAHGSPETQRNLPIFGGFQVYGSCPSSGTHADTHRDAGDPESSKMSPRTKCILYFLLKEMRPRAERSTTLGYAAPQRRAAPASALPPPPRVPPLWVLPSQLAALEVNSLEAARKTEMPEA